MHEQLVFTIAEFCAAHRVTRTGLYDEWKQGRGPRHFRVGQRVLITIEAASDWRREREAAASQAKQVEAA